MKMIKMQFAPKSSNGGKIETPQIETPQTQQTEQVDVPRETPAPVAQPEPTSEKLESLKIALIDAQNIVKSHDAGTVAFTDAMIKAFQIGKDIDVEKSNIKKLLHEQEVAMKRNERIALIDNVIDLAIKHYIVENATPSGENLDEKNEAYAKMKNAREIVANELLAKYPTSKPSTVATAGVAKSTSTNGNKAADILAMFHEQRAAGVPDATIKKNIEAAGHARGTVGAVILAWQRANGEKE